MISHFKKRNIAFIVVSCILVLFIAKSATWDNPEFLFFMSEGFDEPSIPFYILFERAYKIYSNSDHRNLLANFLNGSENKHLIDRYIRAAGVTGDIDSTPVLIKLYREYDNNTYQARLHYIVGRSRYAAEKKLK